LNRRIATSNSSQGKDARPDGSRADAEAGVRSAAGKEPPVTKTSQAKKPSGAKASAKPAGRRAPGDVGQLLRGAYRQTVDEAIPDDLMDLLNKLE
jgi:hypothetical protein